jgi:hypothetical protein
MHPDDFRPEIVHIGVKRPIIVRPADTRAYMDTISTELKTLRDEIIESGINTGLHTYAEALVNEWQEFYDEIYPSWWETGTTHIWNRVDDWRVRVKDLRLKFTRAGGTTVTSESVLQEPEAAISLGRPSVWAWFAMGAVGLWLVIEYMAQRTAGKQAETGFIRAAMGRPKSHKKGLY